ncbi:OmpA family protein [Enterobacteriaceae bacterium RIT691]|nr:OmpA family protein [Enterobacteriaceae bacterium RIT691]
MMTMKKSLMVAALLLLSGCSRTQVTLLPEMSGHVGRVIVTEEGKSTTLDKSGESVHSSILGPRESQSTPDAVRQSNTAIFNAEPAPFASELVYFKSESVEPIVDTASLVKVVKKDCETRQPCQLTLIGHTDATGDSQYNMTLSLKRAQQVRHILVEHGFSAEHIRVRSHGMYDPLVKKPVGVPEPRNRRVEIMVH